MTIKIKTSFWEEKDIETKNEKFEKVIFFEMIVTAVLFLTVMLNVQPGLFNYILLGIGALGVITNIMIIFSKRMYERRQSKEKV